MLDNYILINSENLPKVGDIICREGNYNTVSDDDYHENYFDESTLCEILSITNSDDKSTEPIFKTKILSCGEIFDNHSIIDSYFGEYYIIQDKSKRNHNINSILHA